MDSCPRTLIYGFHEASLAAAFDQLQSEKRLEIVHWIGVPIGGRTFDEDIQQWHLHGIAKTVDSNDAGDASIIGAEILVSHFDQIVDQLSRNVVCQSLEFTRYPSFIRALASHFERMLREKSVQLVLLQNLPHEGFELVLYLVAKRMGITTLMTFQSVICNRFFYCFDLQDFGRFQQIEPSSESIEVELPKEFRKDLFYMRGVNESLVRSIPGSVADEFKRRILFAKIAFKVFKQWIGWYDFWKLPQPRIPPVQRYAWELHRSTVVNVSLDIPYVYFPLHLQPELTTSAIGDRYSDQLCAIENLSEWLPISWRIIVKENPKQTFRYREPPFFERLRKLSKVTLVDRTVDTYSLLANCQFAATITGTVGWEAITGGKRVIVFGRPWYLTLPGVHQWPMVESSEELTGREIDHAELTRAYRDLLCKSALGVVDSAYREAVPGYTAERNTRHIADFLTKQLENLSSSLQARGR